MPYKPSDIRTSNMDSSRSSDINFGDEPSLTQQQFLNEADINYIVKHNALVAPLTREQYESQNFLDLGDSVSYHDAKNYLYEADASFMALPAHIRARFENDPGKFLDFFQDPKNLPEIYELGLATPVSQNTPESPPKPSKAKKTEEEQE
ncbi:MAG: internal scaffolding protein [Microvirus sp.]|nr:MAG: internal scaffolding protein [Microvirus sp.]